MRPILAFIFSDMVLLSCTSEEITILAEIFSKAVINQINLGKTSGSMGRVPGHDLSFTRPGGIRTFIIKI